MNLPYEQISNWIVEDNEIWQMDFMDCRRLYTYINDRGIKVWENDITKLWQIGWIRADLIISEQDFDIEGINLIGESNDHKYFSDLRQLGIPQDNIEKIISSLSDLPKGVEIFFHPFKYYVFYHIQRILGSNISPFQMFYQSHYHKMVDSRINQFNKFVASNQLSELINKWNDLTTLAVISEPCYFAYIFENIKMPPHITEAQQMENIEKYKEKLNHLYQQLPKEEIISCLQDLCWNAEMIEPNKQIQTLLRFMNGRKRLEIKGKLGGARSLKTMAEMIRRMTEYSFGVTLPEEDDMGFAPYLPGIKKEFFGHDRIFDYNTARREFVREMDLDHSARLRWYVEGPTEYYALNPISSLPEIEVINLAGVVYQKQGKGVAFRDNLIQNDRSHVFSVILIDGDNKDNVRAVQQAAKDDVFCGLFQISQPDFEFYNFTIDELEEIIWGLVDKQERTDAYRKILNEAIRGENNASDIIDAAKRSIPSLYQLHKGKEWGEKLREYALNRPNKGETEVIRPFIELVNNVLTSFKTNYVINRENYYIDPSNGHLRKRKSTS